MRVGERLQHLMPATPILIALLLVLVFGTPAAAPALLLLLTALLLAVCLALARERDPGYQLRTAINLVDALREGDLGIRGITAQPGEAAPLIRSINALATHLRSERLALHETLQLLSKVLASLDSAVMTFTAEGRLRFINPAGERLLAGTAAELGAHCSELGLQALLATSGARVQAHAFPGASGRWQITSTAMRSQTQIGHLLVIQPIEQALRAEEARAFQRLLRVLGHEINNSIAPIASVAETLLLLTERPLTTAEQHADLRSGLHLIGHRSAALQRFTASYAQLARLPAPRLAPTDLLHLVNQVAQLFADVELVIEGPRLHVLCDRDQVQQALINLLRNAVEASKLVAASDGSGPIRLRWQRHQQRVRVTIIDGGTGLPLSDNLFVPFFTTKADGSGIGLVLSRQIIEAQHGTLELCERTDGARGAMAVLELPLYESPTESGH
jgi:two-component system, NtrC family, nitrogen regulation sensor histidine kinase NtrY